MAGKLNLIFRSTGIDAHVIPAHQNKKRNGIFF